MEQFSREEEFYRIFKALNITPAPNPIERHFAILRSRVSLYSFSPYSFIQNGRNALLCQCRSIDAALWQNLLQRYDTIKAYVADQVRITRQKDADNLFRQMTYRNDAEMKAVLE